MYEDYPTIYETTLSNSLVYIIIFLTILLGILLFTIFSMAKVYKKANRSFVSAWIPIYNTLVLLEMVTMPKITFFVLLLPIINIFMYYRMYVLLAVAFRKDKKFALGLLFLPFIFFPILAFSKDEYIGIDLKAMEGKSEVNYNPVIVEDDLNITVNEVKEEEKYNSNISIGGGVYQQDYTNNLMSTDYNNQTILNQKTETKPPIDLLASVHNEDNNNSTNIVGTNNDDKLTEVNNQIELSSINDNVNKDLQQVEVKTESVPTTNNQNQEFFDCPRCGTKLKRGMSACFMCGQRID